MAREDRRRRNQKMESWMPNRKDTILTSIKSDSLPARKGPRPQTIRDPLHIQCNGHGDSIYVNQLVDEVLTWPRIESTPSSVRRLVCAHWAIVRGWAEPHYLTSYGLMPAGTVVVYTPRDEQELEVCYFLFSESYRSACGFLGQERQGGSTERDSWVGKNKGSAGAPPTFTNGTISWCTVS